MANKVAFHSRRNRITMAIAVMASVTVGVVAVPIAKLITPRPWTYIGLVGKAGATTLQLQPEMIYVSKEDARTAQQVRYTLENEQDSEGGIESGRFTDREIRRNSTCGNGRWGGGLPIRRIIALETVPVPPHPDISYMAIWIPVDGLYVPKRRPNGIDRDWASLSHIDLDSLNVPTKVTECIGEPQYTATETIETADGPAACTIHSGYHTVTRCAVAAKSGDLVVRITYDLYDGGDVVGASQSVMQFLRRRLKWSGAPTPPIIIKQSVGTEWPI